MAKRRRDKRRPEKAATSRYTDADGNVLELRQSLSSGTIRKIARSEARAGASAEDAWQRRTEMLFEHLAVSWQIAGLPLDDQAMLLGRYRMASADEKQWVRSTIAGHVEEFIPELADRV